MILNGGLKARKRLSGRWTYFPVFVSGFRRRWKSCCCLHACSEQITERPFQWNLNLLACTRIRHISHFWQFSADTSLSPSGISNLNKPKQLSLSASAAVSSLGPKPQQALGEITYVCSQIISRSLQFNSLIEKSEGELLKLKLFRNYNCTHRNSCHFQ